VAVPTGTQFGGFGAREGLQDADSIEGEAWDEESQ
jgi:hypothetical protein